MFVFFSSIFWGFVIMGRFDNVRGEALAVACSVCNELDPVHSLELWRSPDDVADTDGAWAVMYDLHPGRAVCERARLVMTDSTGMLGYDCRGDVTSFLEWCEWASDCIDAGLSVHAARAWLSWFGARSINDTPDARGLGETYLGAYCTRDAVADIFDLSAVLVIRGYGGWYVWAL